PAPNVSQRGGQSAAVTLLDMMLTYFWRNEDKNKRSDIYDSLMLKNASSQSTDHRTKNTAERRFRKHVYDVLSKTFPWVLTVNNVRVCVSDQRSVLPVEILLPRRGAYSNANAEYAFVGRVLYDQYKSVVDPHGHVAYLVSNHSNLVETYPMFWSYVFLEKVPAYCDYVADSWSDERGIFSADTYYSGWLNADAIVMLAKSITNLPFGNKSEEASLGVRAMYNFEMLSSAYDGDYLFTAAVLRNTYKFAYDNCLYVPRGVPSAEIAAISKREVLLGVRNATVADVVSDVNNIEIEDRRHRKVTSGGVGCLNSGGRPRENVATKISQSVESVVKTMLPRVCESIGMPSVIVNALVSTSRLQLLDLVRMIDSVLFQHSDWEERIERGLKNIPSLMNNVTRTPLVSFHPSKSVYTQVVGDTTVELPGFENSIVLSTYVDPETNKRLCPLKFLLHEPFLYFNKGSGRYFSHSSGEHPMPFTQIEGLRILYHLLC
ncbi:unnamed protein product, partial [Ixodes hexagonus]